MKPQAELNHTFMPIAIIGMGCFFPQSPGLSQYWRLLLAGEDAIREVPDTHWSPEDYFDPDPKKPDHVYCKRGGFLGHLPFDPTEFGIPPNAIEATDTSQLLGLLAAKQALEDAGYGDKGRSFNRQRTSVMLGVTGTQELVIPLGARLGHPRWRRAMVQAGIDPKTAATVVESISDSYVPWQENSFPGLLGNVVAGRICNRLDLGGTNCVVDAACASSFSAINMALLDLSTRRSDMVITGGVDTINDIFMHMCFAKTYILSHSGDIRPFSKDADGTVLGEGIGILVLKRLEDAENDGDRIYAVIKGAGASSDGRSQSIYAPRPEGQARALRRAYRAAEITPASVSLVEAHGTGTRVGDQVEFEALRQVFSDSANHTSQCALGSVKSMIGHTKAAAGAAGLIKTALALYHKVLPPTLKAENPDPKLQLSTSPFYLNRKARPWIVDSTQPRRAGVSAFGFGGSNYHLVLEEHTPDKQAVAWNASTEIVALSGDSQGAIHEQLRRLLADCRAKRATPAAMSIKAARSRRKFKATDAHRLLIIIEPRDDALAEWRRRLEAAHHMLDNQLSEPENGCRHKIHYGHGQTAGRLAFLFPGQGSQYVGMARDVICTFPEAFAVLEAAEAHFKASCRLSDYIFPREAGRRGRYQRQSQQLTRTEIAQPSIGTVSAALLKVLNRFEVTPDAACGHSFGELTALLAAESISLEDYFDLALQRGRCMAEAAGDADTPDGVMMAVKAPLERLIQLAEDIPDLVVANRNAPDQGVLSGTPSAMSLAQERCAQRGYPTTMLTVSAAFHSPQMESAQRKFQNAVSGSNIRVPRIPIWANATGRPYAKDIAQIKQTLSDQLLNPVHFVEAIEHMSRNGCRTFLEIGPKSVLTGLVKRILPDAECHALAMDISAGRGSGLVDLAQVLCQLAALGLTVNLNHWERSPETTRAPLMQVQLNGANYRIPQASASPDTTPVRTTTVDSRDPRAQDSQAPHPTPPSPTPGVPQGLLSQGPDPDQVRKPHHGRNTMPNDTKKTESLTVQALQMAQQGLEAMQKLQQQTAAVHQKFLEAQSDASRALQQMLNSSQRLAELSMGHSPDANTPPLAASLVEKHQNADTAAAVSPTASTDPDGVEIPIEPVSPADVRPPYPSAGTFSPPASAIAGESESPSIGDTAAAPPTSAAAGSPAIQDTLLAVVSQLTGYPTEMLQLEMDIEADLGIDSIKRVEILSTLEEKMPDLPKISPDQIGILNTLGDIIAYLNRGSTPSVKPAPHPATSQTDTATIPEPLTPLLLDTVSQLTGYPTEMLQLDMDIEADLGIDSIKRVEILSTLEEKMPDLPKISPDQLGTLKTLGQILTYLTASDKTIAPVAAPAASQAKAFTELRVSRSEDTVGPVASLERSLVELLPAPPLPERVANTLEGQRIYLLGNPTGLTAALAQQLSHRGILTSLVSPHEVQALCRKGSSGLEQAAGLIIVAPHTGSPDSLSAGTAMEFIDSCFRLAQGLAKTLMASAQKCGALLATVTRLDGAFGFRRPEHINPLFGGLTGLPKTAAHEWPGIVCRAVDVDPEWGDVESIADAVATELMHANADGPIEVGLDPHARLTPMVTASPYPSTPTVDPGLGSEDVVVVSGGARGVTAAAAIKLAQETQSVMVLLGRSAAPQPEPPWLVALKDEASIKKAILDHDFEGHTPSPTDLQARFRHYLAGREIQTTLQHIQQAGATAVYYQTDVRDADAVQEVLSEVRGTYGKITTIIHGAGVLEDRRIVDKTPQQFTRVVDTKVQGLRSLLAATRQDALRHLILFSSVSARWGNQGQVDYAIANEILNKIAQQEAAARPDCRVVAINWGPWDGGMVTPTLKREFARRQIDLLPIDMGAAAMVQEMALPPGSPAEVIVGSPLRPIESAPETDTIDPAEAPLTSPAPGHGLALTFKRELDLESHPVLAAHQLNGQAVVPFALIAEWFGHGALHANPGLMLHGIDNMRLLQGIKIENDPRTIRVLAGKMQKKGAFFNVDVELRDGFKNNIDVVHSRAQAILTDIDFPAPERYTRPGDITVSPYSRTVEEIYDHILFHGDSLKGLRRIIGSSDQGMIAEITSAPDPAQWMENPLRSHWIIDPLALDSAFQMACVWCYDNAGAVSLPSYCGSYRQYRSRFPADGMIAVLKITSLREHKMRGDVTFLDHQEACVAQILGYEAVIDISLNRAFKPQNSAA